MNKKRINYEPNGERKQINKTKPRYNYNNRMGRDGTRAHTHAFNNGDPVSIFNLFIIVRSMRTKDIFFRNTHSVLFYSWKRS